MGILLLHERPYYSKQLQEHKQKPLSLSETELSSESLVVPLLLTLAGCRSSIPVVIYRQPFHFTLVSLSCVWWWASHLPRGPPSACLLLQGTRSQVRVLNLSLSGDMSWGHPGLTTAEVSSLCWPYLYKKKVHLQWYRVVLLCSTGQPLLICTHAHSKNLTVAMSIMLQMSVIQNKFNLPRMSYR